MPLIKIYGERNSGTNYLLRVLELNFEAAFLRGDVPRLWRRLFGARELPRDIYFRLTYRRNLGWKHSSAPDLHAISSSAHPQDVFFVTVTKNPYPWLLSMYRRPYHYQEEKGTFAEFLTRPWKTLGREQHALPYDNPIALWNDKNRSYLGLADYARCINLRYEDLLADLPATLRSVASRSGVLPRSGSFANVAESTKRDTKSFADYQDYYLNERWKRELEPSTLGIIDKYLDKATVDKFGYAILDHT